MISVIIACVFLTLTTANVIIEDSQANVVKYENSNDGVGNYKFSYETSNGITREEIGYLVNVGEENEHLVVQGSYSYTDKEGKLVRIRYTADENGYHIKPSTQALYSLSAPLVATLLGK